VRLAWPVGCTLTPTLTVSPATPASDPGQKLAGSRREKSSKKKNRTTRNTGRTTA
jgi:hypothetical protein